MQRKRIPLVTSVLVFTSLVLAGHWNSLLAQTTQPDGLAYQVSAPFNRQYEPDQLGEILSWIDCEKAVSAVTLHRGLLVVPLSFDFGGGEGNGALVVYNIDDPHKPVAVFDSRDFPKQYHTESQRNYLGDIGEIHGLYFHNDMLLLQEKGHDRAGSCILDLGPLYDDDPNTLPQVVSRYSFPGVERSTIYDGFSFSPAWVGGKYAYCPTGSSGLYIIDTENLDQPKLLSHLTKGELYNQTPRAVNPIGDMLVLSPAVVATEEEDMIFLDVGDPAKPSLINHHRIKLGYLGIVYGSRFYNGAYAAARGTDKLSEIVTYDFADVHNVRDIPLASPQDVIYRPEYVYLQDDDLFIGHYPGLSKWTIKDDVATLDPDSAIEPQFPPANDYAFVSPAGNLVVASSDHDVKSKVNIGVHQIEPDRKGPELRYVLPQPGQKNVSVHGKVGLSFSDFIDGGCLEHGAVSIREKGSGRIVPCGVSHGLGIVHAVPSAPLQENTTYEVLVTNQLLDLVGNSYEDEPLVTTFSTGDELTNFNCQIATDVPRVVGQPVRLQASINNPAMTDSVLYSWDFGDDTEATSFSAEAVVEKTFAEAGNYNIILKAKERDTKKVVQSSAVQVVHAELTTTRPVASSTMYLDDDKLNGGKGRLFVVNPDNDTLTAIDTASGTVIYEQATDAKPVSVIRYGDQVWVSCRQADTIAIHALKTGERLKTIRLHYGSAPHGLTVDEAVGRCYVVLSATGQLQEIDAKTTELARNIQLAGPLRNVAWIPAKQMIVAPQFMAADQQGARFQGVDVNDWKVAVSQTLEPSLSNDGQSNGRGYPNYLGSMAVNPEQTRLWIPGKKDNLFRGLQRDGEPLVFDHTVRSIAVSIDLEGNSETVEQRIDLDNSDFATTASFNHLGNVLYIATMGTQTITAVDAYHPTKSSVFNTYGQGAMAIVGNRAGDRLYVHNQLSRSISVFESQPDGGLQYATQWDTVSKEKLSPDVLSGKRLFHNTVRSHLSREGYMSCASCHMDGSHDGRVWDLSNLGEGLRNTIDLRGKAGMKHGSLHWTGNFDEVQDFDDQIRKLNEGTGFLFDAVKRPQRKFFPHKAGMIAELDNLAKYVSSLADYPKSPFKDHDGNLTELAVKGRSLFISLKCHNCHAGPTFTDSISGKRHDVGTAKSTSGHRLGEALSGFDTPTLIGLWQSAPYLHDGSAATLADVFNAGTGEQADVHKTADKLNETEQQELTEYLLQLDSEGRVTAQDVASRNTKPTFEQAEYKFEYAYRYDRRTHPIGTVVATDAESQPALTYQVTPSVYSNLFSIDSSTGELSFEFKDIYFRDIANMAFDETRTFSIIISASDNDEFVEQGSTKVVVEVNFPRLLIKTTELSRLKRLNAAMDSGKKIKPKEQAELDGLLKRICTVYETAKTKTASVKSLSDKKQPKKQKQFTEWDANEDGKLSITELPPKTHGDFDWADSNGDGFLSVKECNKFLHFRERIKEGQKSIPADTHIIRNVEYVEDGHSRHKLDIYLPKRAGTSSDTKPLPLVIWIHGGGWHNGNKDMLQQQAIVLEHGFALASINYRLTRHAAFPAQIHDCKAAIRFLRKHASEYGINPDRIGVWGSSAGGHLVALLGTTGDVAELEGDLGETSTSSRVQAVCDWFGPTNLVGFNKLKNDAGKPKFDDPKSTIAKLVGGPLSQRGDVAKQASPATYVSEDDAPFLIMHGDQDPLVPLEQSQTFHRLLTEASVPSEFVTIEGVGHAFFTQPEELKRIVDFFHSNL